jgi:hypothetical protein
MKKEVINQIIQSQIAQGLIHHNDGSKQEGFEMGILYMINQGQTLPKDSVSGCPFEAYAIFCIECDRQGIKPIKHKDYLEMG